MGHTLRRAYSIFRHPATKGWLITAALALLIKVIDTVIDHRWLQTADPTAHWDLEFLILAAGMLLVNWIQELSLCLFFIWHHYAWKRYAFESIDNLAFLGHLVRQSLAMACFMWAVHLRTRLMTSNANLTQLQERTQHRLCLGLQASALAHELRQPLGHLLLQMQLLQFRLEQADAVDPALETPLDEVKKSGRQINRLITTMTQLLRPPAVIRSRANLCAVVKRSLWELQSDIAGAKVTVECHGIKRPAWIEGDAEALLIACKNVLHNALTALKEMPPVERRLRVQLDCGPETVVLTIADSGPGLPTAEIHELLMNSSSRDGMGLGLLTVQAIARRHNGYLSLNRSAELGGAELRLSFPAAVQTNVGSDTAPPGAPAQHR